MEQDVTWTYEEYGTSHEGRVGVLLADGSSPDPVYFDSASSGSGWDVTHWSVYDGTGPYTPRPKAHTLRAECSCGWTGTHHPIDWTTTDDDTPFLDTGMHTADQCEEDFDQHIITVGNTTIPLPTELEKLLRTVGDAIEDLGQNSPAAAIKAARTLELIAQRAAHAPAHETRHQKPESVAAALGLDIDDTRSLLARYGGWHPYLA